MNRKNLESLLKEKGYKEGGTKEACIKAREFLRAAVCEGNTLRSRYFGLNANEFCEAVKVLVAFAYEHDDEVPKRWNCDSDCKRIFEAFCLGECGVDKNSKNTCPYFIDDGEV